MLCPYKEGKLAQNLILRSNGDGVISKNGLKTDSLHIAPSELLLFRLLWSINISRLTALKILYFKGLHQKPTLMSSQEGSLGYFPSLDGLRGWVKK